MAWEPWDEAEYLQQLEAERILYAWCLERLGGLTPQEALQRALRRYPYEPPDTPCRGILFHADAWFWALCKLHGNEHRNWPQIDSAVRVQYEAEVKRVYGRSDTPLTCDQVLSIAHADARTLCHDLSPYRIQLTLEDDGWHVDYDLKDQNWKGGGPHYVIDAHTGAIRSKRYEQ